MENGSTKISQNLHVSQLLSLLTTKKSRAISWFKDTAHEHVAHVRSLVAILQNHGISLGMLKTNRVGYVVYQDEYQVVAEPFGGEEYYAFSETGLRKSGPAGS